MNPLPSSHSPTRRRFLAASSATALAAATGVLAPTFASAQAKKRNIRKALKFSMIKQGESIAEKVAVAKQAGFDGVEFDNTPLTDAQVGEIQAAIKENGLEVPGLVCGSIGRKLGSFDEAERKEAIGQFAASLRHTKALGGTTVLLYPGAVDATHQYDVVYETLQKSIRELIPVCEETGVKIACENVWNNIFISPIEVKTFVDSFESPHVGWYFDIGNIVRYGWPEHWIRILGPRILKLDIKDYSRDIQMNEGARKGFGVELGEGSVDWAEVMKALDEIQYSGGWGSAEVAGGDLARLTDISQRMDKLFAM